MAAVTFSEALAAVQGCQVSPEATACVEAFGLEHGGASEALRAEVGPDDAEAAGSAYLELDEWVLQWNRRQIRRVA
jgi:hypothetical protein